MLSALVFPLALAGCSGSFSIGGPDYEALEKDIATELDKAYTSMSRKVDSVKCPRLADEPATGDTFVCVAKVDDKDIRVDVRVEDEEGTVKFATRDVAFDLAATAAGISTDATDQLGFAVTVDCGQGLKIVEVGSTFTCTAIEAEGDSATVVVTARNDGGSSWEIAE
ncbi:uncharacterized protein DUF4333 [Nocardia caishijiensis]|uniref:Uncharacterized protein DUF4333 n=1 Tax=Nocardia caishijiensis TaxID=184756 RepID=A0ABQ6YQQ0_9NOCA|nr:uncharacterized protein DUF4333 [Nocardia caishijiensis]